MIQIDQDDLTHVLPPYFTILTQVFFMQFLDGWVIFAEYARPRPPPQGPPQP